MITEHRGQFAAFNARESRKILDLLIVLELTSGCAAFINDDDLQICHRCIDGGRQTGWAGTDYNYVIDLYHIELPCTLLFIIRFVFYMSFLKAELTQKRYLTETPSFSAIDARF